ncbi:DUF2237 family protein [Maribacter sp. ACAM166]|uniref:DUF2237 family protein n=1 Tax=Maribacter sp. ACAM166 TaxID=2508996 RepID=UPI0010FEF49F|nr:DUF2237 domain-containing protein [Maribacter sp. ACAM166]TLP75414.1 DUF2237 domain-containing protein [Maribacter sp. ACAM166]
MSTNVLDTTLISCCYEPLTGFYRDGYCKTGPEDVGTHTVCAIMTLEFLEYSKNQGNDLTTPLPMYKFPGLKPGDKWCLCATRWKQAANAGAAPPVILQATHKKTLELVDFSLLLEHKW